MALKMLKRDANVLKKSIKKKDKSKSKSKGQETLKKAVNEIKKEIQIKEDKLEKKKGEQRRGIIYLRHVPHGFYEEEMRAYFSQFGRVYRIKLARSTKTGKSKGFAFVEFEFEEVAKIAAETMDNYLMFDRLIKCELLSPEETKPNEIFRNNEITQDNYPGLINKKMGKELEEVEVDEKKYLKKRLRKLALHNKKMAQLGINYEYKIPSRMKNRSSVEKSKSPKATAVESDSSESSNEVELDDENELENIILKQTHKKSLVRDQEVEEKACIVESKKSPMIQNKNKKSTTPLQVQTAKQQIKRKSEPIKKSTPDLPKISPKMLRSRSRKSEIHTKMPTPPQKQKIVEKKQELKNRKSMNMQINEDKNKTPKLPTKMNQVQVKETTPKLPTKLNQVKETTAHKSVPTPTSSTTSTNAKKGFVAKFSPKMTRSKTRKSENFSTTLKKPSPQTFNKGNKGRKSIR